MFVTSGNMMPTWLVRKARLGTAMLVKEDRLALMDPSRLVVTWPIAARLVMPDWTFFTMLDTSHTLACTPLTAFDTPDTLPRMLDDATLIIP